MYLFDVVLECEGPRVAGAAQLTRELQVVLARVSLRVDADRVERRERTITMLAGEGFSVRILMSSQLHGRLEGFRAVRAFVGADLGVRQ